MALGENGQDLGEAGLITALDLARLLKVSTRTLWRLRSAGQLPQPVRLGGAVRWQMAEVKKWIAAGCPSADLPRK